MNLLDSGASLCGLNLPTFRILADHFPKCSKSTSPNIDFKTLTVANKDEVPIQFNDILSIQTPVHGSTDNVVILFASILGIFFEEYVETLNIDHMSLISNTTHESHVNSLLFTAHKEKDYPYTSQVIHCPFQPTIPLTFTTSENGKNFPSTPHPFSNSHVNSTFIFLQVYQNTKVDSNSCPVIIQNFTHHSAITSQGYIVYIEKIATILEPPHYKVNDVSSLKHTVFHTFYPELSEPKPMFVVLLLTILKLKSIICNLLNFYTVLFLLYHTLQMLKNSSKNSKSKL